MEQRRDEYYEDGVQAVPADALQALDGDAQEAGGEYQPSPEYEGSIGETMFDTPQARDGMVVSLIPREQVGHVPNQALVRIKSLDSENKLERQYLGIIQQGPFAEPDGLRADAPIVVATTVRGKGRFFMPRYHGRMHIELLGEEVERGLVPPRFRPFPNSPVFLLGTEETARILRCGGDLDIGRAIGHEDLQVGIPSDKKSVLPRHTGILGTTGSGKSTTVSRLIHQAQEANMAVVLLDVEGEYTEIDRPAEEEGMLNALRVRDISPDGVSNTHIYHLAGTETTNPSHPGGPTQFYLPFDRLSPYTVTEILELTDAQTHRYWQAYEATKSLLRDLGVFPNRMMGKADPEEERQYMELDEFETGYPRMTLSHLIDVAGVFLNNVEKSPGEPRLYNDVFKSNADRVKAQVGSFRADSAASWRALLARLWRLQRLGVFDVRQQGAKPIDYASLVQPGRVSIIDLSDMESPELRNLVIADVVRGVHKAQEDAYSQAARDGASLPRTLLMVEEAHEFLSRERISKMPNLFQQVSRIAKRGRKRWLGLVFVTQHPQHLPDELFGLINSYALHKINDAGVISRLRRSIGGIDDGLWDRLTALSPGQAVVSSTHMARPLLVAIDPTPCKLRMAEE